MTVSDDKLTALFYLILRDTEVSCAELSEIITRHMDKIAQVDHVIFSDRTLGAAAASLVDQLREAMNSPTQTVI